MCTLEKKNREHAKQGFLTSPYMGWSSEEQRLHLIFISLVNQTLSIEHDSWPFCKWSWVMSSVIIICDHSKLERLSDCVSHGVKRWLTSKLRWCPQGQHTRFSLCQKTSDLNGFNTWDWLVASPHLKGVNWDLLLWRIPDSLRISIFLVLHSLP